MMVRLFLFFVIAFTALGQSQKMDEEEREESRIAAQAMQIKDYARAVEVYRTYALRGRAWAQFRLGMRYMKGEGVTQDKEFALVWFCRAADHGDVTAQHDIGWMFANGDGLPKDDSEALKWFRKAAEQEFAESQYYIGWAYANGLGVQTDYSEARSWFSKAAEQDHADAQLSLGMIYCNGQGAAQDMVQCLTWLLIAEQGLSDAAKVQVARAKNWATPKQFQEAEKAASKWRDQLFLPR